MSIRYSNIYKELRFSNDVPLSTYQDFIDRNWRELEMYFINNIRPKTSRTIVAKQISKSTYELTQTVVTLRLLYPTPINSTKSRSKFREQFKSWYYI